MTGPIKKAATQRDLDALAFSVLASFHQHGPMQWRDWFQATRTRRGNLGLGNGTFSEAVKRLVAAGRVRIDKTGRYQVVLDAMGDDVADTGLYQPKVPSEVTDAPNANGTDRPLTETYSATSETRPSAGVFLEAFREVEAENEKLRAENKRLVNWVMGDDCDALSVLQSLYLNPDEPAGNRIKAASASIGYERPKLTASIGIVMDFRERVRQARLKADAKLLEQAPKTIEHIPDEPA